MITAPAPPDAPLGIYIHIPFCSHICPYCDFTTYAGKESFIPRYVDAVVRDLETQAPWHHDRDAASVFVGGGTPSLLTGEQMSRIIAACTANFRLQPDAEISMEANPNGLDASTLAGFREAGINRMSIGAQTFDRRGLRSLGRQHESTDTVEAVRAAHAAGFANVSLDFIFGWPGQRQEIWERDLDAVLGMDAAMLSHVSLYSLIVEPGTPYADAAARGILQIPDDDAAADLYDTAVRMLGDAGWTHYEIANWARHPNLLSHHNVLYWRHGDYLAVGAGAHGHVAGTRVMNHLLPETYATAIEHGESPASNLETIDARTAQGETMMLGLRLLQEGVSTEAFAVRHGVTLNAVYGPVVEDLVQIGMLERTSIGVRLTVPGRMLANDVAERFV